MENNFEMFKRPSLINSIKSWSYTKKMIVLLSIFFVLLNILPPLIGNIPLCFGGDDAVQYHIFTRNFIHSIKDGTFSLYNTNAYYGSSIFEFEYYVPLDIFTLITFLLDYIMPFDYAYSATTALKIVSGVAMTYLLFKKLGFKEKTSFFVSWIYPITACIAFSYLFPCYVSMMFYIPLTIYLMIYEKDFNIKWRTMIMSFLLMLFNFYSGYMTVAIAMTFLLFADVIKTEKLNKKFWKKEIVSLLKYVPFILIGVASSAFVLIPSILYLLNNSSTSRYATFIYSWQHIFVLFLNTISPTSSYSRTMVIGNEGYISYQTGLYFSVFGILSIISLLLASNKENKKKYIGVLIVELVMIMVPLFSWIYSMSLAGYSRHFTLFSLVNLYLLGLNYERQGHELEIYKHKKLFIVVLTVPIVTLMAELISSDKARILDVSFTNVSFMIVWLLYFYASFKTTSFKRLIFGLEFTIGLFLVFSPSLRYYDGSISAANKNDEIMNYIAEKYDIKPEERIHYRYDYNFNMVTSKTTTSGNLFSSFYFNEIDKYTNIYYKETNRYIRWSKNDTATLDLLRGSFENYKYFVIEDKYKDSYITSLLTLIGNEEGYAVYENPYYNNAYIYYNQIEKSKNYVDNVLNINDAVILNENVLNKISGHHINYKDFNISSQNAEIENIDNLESPHKFTLYTDELASLAGQKYFINIASVNDNEIEVIYDDNTVENIYCNSFVTDKKIKGFVFYSQMIEENVNIYAVPYEEYLDLLNGYHSEGAAKYTYIKNGFHIDVNKANDKAVVVLPFTYSDELYCEEGYRLVEANGGLIGVVLDEGVTTASLNIKIKPVGLDTGIKISMILTPIFIVICSAGICLENKKFVQKGIIWYN